MTKDATELSNPLRHVVEVDALPAQGMTVTLAADPGQLAALADLFSVPSVNSFHAELAVKPFRTTGASVTGRVEASLTQRCVVTLEPVVQTIDEAVDVKLVPADDENRPIDQREIEIDPEGIDPPDEFTGGLIDIGAIALEHFALGIDPYPRKPGVRFDAAAGAGEPTERDVEASPFGILNRLKADDPS